MRKLYKKLKREMELLHLYSIYDVEYRAKPKQDSTDDWLIVMTVVLCGAGYALIQMVSY